MKKTVLAFVATFAIAGSALAQTPADIKNFRTVTETPATATTVVPVKEEVKKPVKKATTKKTSTKKSTSTTSSTTVKDGAEKTETKTETKTEEKK